MIRLKALELFGFKSFADRTRFEFPAGITVVVGPNGAGKSNVVDAIKWVLGEQSPRSLRSHEMTDVIFAGSSGRKPLNAAEVSLVFDNSSRLLPTDTDDVQIMRRVYRSGESEYLVNGEPSRLRDIRELFSGTGAATEAYSVIEQGRVDALLVASGRDRRAIFEEAAGITRFRTRRTESLRRLERAEQNRQRLADIVGEVSSRLETVRHQAARARRWRQMTDRLRQLRLAAAAADLAGVDADVASIDQLLEAARRELSCIEEDARRTASRMEEIDALQQEILPQLSEIQAVMTADKQRAAAAEATLSLLRTHRIEVSLAATQSETALSAHTTSGWEAVGAVGRAIAETQSLETELKRISERLKTCVEAAEGTHTNATDAKQRHAAHANTLDELQRSRLRLETQYEQSMTRVDDSRKEMQERRTKIDSTRLNRAGLLESQAHWEGNLDALCKRLEFLVSELESLEITEHHRSQSLERGWSDLAGWKAKSEACRERQTVLQEIIHRQEGLSDTAKKLLSHEPGSAGVPGLQGVLADLVIASVEWAPLVDIALGVLSQSLVVESLDDVVDWHAEWSSSEAGQAIVAAGGRVTFLAATALPDPLPLENEPSLDQGSTSRLTVIAAHPDPACGIIGRLDRLMSADRLENNLSDCSQDLMRRLLGRVWIVECLEDARILARNSPPGTLYLTRQGECCSADGFLEIGTTANATGLIARRSELRSLAQREHELAETVVAATTAVGQLQADLASIRQDIRQSHERRQRAAETIAAARADLDQSRREVIASDNAILAAEAALLDAQRQSTERTAIRDAAMLAIEVHDNNIQEAIGRLACSYSDIQAIDRDRGEVIDEINRLRIEQATCVERLARSHEAVIARKAELALRRDEREAASRRFKEAERKATAIDLDILGATSLLAEATVAAEASTTVLTHLTQSRDALDADKHSVAALNAAARVAMVTLSETVHTQQLHASESQHRRARIIERIRDDYAIDIDVEKNQLHPAEVLATDIPENRDDIDRDIEELRRKLSAMTTVNLEALAESESLTERLASLETQLADVTEAKQTIEQLIARIDEDSRRILSETIETVRCHFRELFERLFGGGQADIVLDPDMDLLDTSVEIVARPPGKEPRSISLLSGGEKTMTCVALLLAIFRSHPSPFCVLDEVDAALDEANVDRFVGVLRDFLSSTQFIVVTHSKKTMATATTLYGVTMEESGVSKRISVRFESTAAVTAHASQKAA